MLLVGVAAGVALAMLLYAIYLNELSSMTKLRGEDAHDPGRDLSAGELYSLLDANKDLPVVAVCMGNHVLKDGIWRVFSMTEDSYVVREDGKVVLGDSVRTVKDMRHVLEFVTGKGYSRKDPYVVLEEFSALPWAKALVIRLVQRGD